MRINVISIKQNGNVFYIGKIKAKDLISIASTKIRKSKNSIDYKNYLSEIDDLLKEGIDRGNVWYLKKFTRDDNIQRKQSIARLKEIGHYIESPNTIFPNSIICNFFAQNEEDIIINEKEGYIEFNPQKIDITIIDGQHRLGGFNYTNNKYFYLDNFELVITILIGLLPTQQAELFATINGKQKPVNRSILYDLSAMTESEYSEQVLAHLITTWFNVNSQSPLQDKIKILGAGYGTVSQALMIDAVRRLFSKRSIKNTNTLDLPIFYKEFIEHKSENIVMCLLDYFCAVQKVYYDYWNSENSSILLKSTGIAGLIKAYPTFYLYLNQQQIFDREKRYYKLKAILYDAKLNGFVPDSNYYGGGGFSVQSDFAKNLILKSFGNDGSEIRRIFILHNAV